MGCFCHLFLAALCMLGSQGAGLLLRRGSTLPSEAVSAHPLGSLTFCQHQGRGLEANWPCPGCPSTNPILSLQLNQQSYSGTGLRPEMSITAQMSLQERWRRPVWFLRFLPGRPRDAGSSLSCALLALGFHSSLVSGNKARGPKVCERSWGWRSHPPGTCSFTLTGSLCGHIVVCF